MSINKLRLNRFLILGWILIYPSAIQEIAMAQVATPPPAAPSEPDQPWPARRLPDTKNNTHARFGSVT